MLNRIKVFSRNHYKLIMLAIITAVLAHSYFIFKDIEYGHLMVGTGDQTYQMILFKDYLYKQFSEGNFFYNFTFNGGGNFFTNLSYYYSTSMVYYLTVLITYLLEAIGLLSNIGTAYWANTIIIISIIRSALILFITTKLIEIYNIQRTIAFLGSTIYAISVIYFRHVILWEFFADAMIWLPLLILGSEKIIRQQTGAIFSIGVFLAMFNNGYFAFKSFLFLILYIIIRAFIKLDRSEASLLKQIKSYLTYGFLGAVMALPGFIPFVLGYLNTSRLSPEFDIPWTNFQLRHLNMFLFTDNTFLIPSLFIALALTLRLYKNKAFRLFSLLSITLIVLRYNPKLASITNGLSYPQYRWMYILNLFIAIAISIGIQHLYNNRKQIELKKSLAIGSIITGIIYLTIYLTLQEEFNYSFQKTIILIAFMQLGVLLVYVLWDKFKMQYFLLLIIALSISVTWVSNRQLYYDYGLRKEDFFVDRFDDEISKYQQAINYIEEDADGFYRIDYFEGSNYTLPFEVSTFNLYSSFQNKNQQFFERDFQILSDRDSNGEYSGLGKRKILNSLLKVDYIIASDWRSFRVPSGYEEVALFENIKVYKNTQPLEFIHPVRDVYATEDFHNETFKDELILNAVITEDIERTVINTNNQSLINEVSFALEFNNIDYEEDVLCVSEDNNVRISIEEDIPKDGSVVLEYTLEPLDRLGEFEYTVNDYTIELNGAGLAYSEQRFRNRIPINDSDEILFKLDEATDYFFKVHNVHYVSNEAFENRLEEEAQLDYSYSYTENSVNVNFDNKDDYPIMVLPIFDELGWRVKVNGEDQKLLNVNSGMIGFEIPSGEVDIELEFKQPYFAETIILAIGGLIGLLIIEKQRKSQEYEE